MHSEIFFLNMTKIYQIYKYIFKHVLKPIKYINNFCKCALKSIKYINHFLKCALKPNKYTN